MVEVVRLQIQKAQSTITTEHSGTELKKRMIVSINEM